MKKYMKPALMAVQLESNEILNIPMSDSQGNGTIGSKRLEEDEFLEFQEIEDNLNPWKRNK